MRLDVALLPDKALDLSRSVCVVVDVLRASSSIVTLLSRGVSPVVVAASIEDALELSGRLPGYLLCGEKDGLPPPGFEYGNSPSEFSKLDLAGASAILATSNGTRILAALAEAPAVLVGCLLNRTAAARAALRIASERGLDIAIICSAAHGGSTFVLEDALGAAAIADAALLLNASLEASDAARFARSAFTTAARDIAAAVTSAYHARELIEAGMGEDVAYCAQLDVSDVAPMIEQGDGGVLVLRSLEG